jgi:predicted exporter
MTAASPRRRALVLAAWLVALLLAIWQITQTRFTADLSAFLPASPDARQQLLIEQLHSGVAARMLLAGIEGGTAEQRTAASRRLAAEMRASGLFEQVANGETGAWADVGQWLVERRYALSPAVNAERFSPQGLRDAIDETLSLLGTPAGNAAKPLLERDPTGETQRIAENLIPSSAPRTEQGVWVSRVHARALLLLTVSAPGADLDAQARAIEHVRQAFAPLAADGLTLQLSGAPLFGVDSRARIEREVHWLAVAGVLLMSTLLLLSFGSLPALGVALLPVATGLVAGVAAVGLVFGTVHGITLGFGSTLIGEAVDYAIYYLIQVRSGTAHGEPPSVARWLRTGWPTVRLGLLTSVCGFAALAFSAFPGLAQLGVFSIAGLVAAALATRFVLPVLMPAGARSSRARPVLGRTARWAIARLPALKWPLVALGVAAAIVVWQRSDLWRADLSSLSPIPREMLGLDESLRADLLPSDGGTLVVVQGADAQTTLQRAERAAERLDALRDRGDIVGYDSVTRLLPSEVTQQARLASLPEAAPLRAALQQALQGAPLAATRLAPFIDDIARARQRAPDTPASVRGGPIAPLVGALLLARADGSHVALLPVQLAPGKQDVATLTAALAGLPDTQAIDVGAELKRLYRHYLDEARTQALLGGLGVLLLIAVALRSWRRVLAVSQPLLLAVVITLGGFAALGVSLGILHLVGLLLTVAVGSNYALFFDLMRDQNAIHNATDDDTLASLVLANLTTVLSFGLIALSSIAALSAIGRVVAPGAFLALLLAAAFAPRPSKAPRSV